MIYHNYNNLDEETQNRLLKNSKSEVEQKFGKDLKVYTNAHHLNYEDILYEAIKNLYSYQYVFNI